jgi:hypothetical protein
VEKRYKSIKGPNSLTNQDILTQAEKVEERKQSNASMAKQFSLGFAKAKGDISLNKKVHKEFFTQPVQMSQANDDRV